MLPYLRKDSLAGHRTGEADPWPKVQPFLLRLRRPMAVLVVHHTNKKRHPARLGAARGRPRPRDQCELLEKALQRNISPDSPGKACYRLGCRRLRVLLSATCRCLIVTPTGLVGARAARCRRYVSRGYEK